MGSCVGVGGGGDYVVVWLGVCVLLVCYGDWCGVGFCDGGV